MAPVIRELKLRAVADSLEVFVCVTAQHRGMLDQVLELFNIQPNVDLDLMQPDQTLGAFASRALIALQEAIEQAHPDVVLVQGDTTTAMVAALAAFYHKIPVGHVEAGLRTYQRYHPFPEEINRRLVGVLASFHFAPTQTAAVALRAEGVDDQTILVTGNTVIDALQWIAGQPPSTEAQALLATLGLSADSDGVQPERTGLRTILVTAHRRENHGEPFEQICRALLAILERNPGVQIVYPVHPNPNVREPVTRLLVGRERLHLIEPVSYEPFVHLMRRVALVLTDSGGLQEEAPALGKPVLVLRRETERPEAITAGTAKLVGTGTATIIGETERLLRDTNAYAQMANAVSPFGDGHAAERIVERILAENASPIVR